MNKGYFRSIITFMGAVLAYMMGSGFATGQELLQYYVAYGDQAILVGITLAAVLIFANWGFAKAGHQKNFDQGFAIFNYYCGEKLGKVFDWFTTVFCFMSFIVMLAGAGSTLLQQYQLPLLIGVIAMAVFAAVTVSCGLNSLVEIIGKVGPILAICVLLIGIITINDYSDALTPNLERITNKDISLLQASNSWLLAGLSNGGLSLLISAGFMARLGSTNEFKPLMIGQSLGITAYSAISVLVSFALISNIDYIAGSQIPNLLLANNISPFLGHIFGIIIFAAIYTTACPLLWTTAARIAKEGSRNFKISTFLLAGAGIILALSFPFDILINYVYVINGYGGAVFLVIMIIRETLWAVGKIRCKLTHSSKR